MKKAICTFLTIFILTSLVSCDSKNDNKAVSKTDFYFDTVITITLYENKPELIDKCFDICNDYENMLSKTIEESDVSKINQANGKPVAVHSDTIELINKSLYYSKLSHGSFDITIGAVSSLWDFTSDTPVIPNNASIQSALEKVDYNNIIIKDDTVSLSCDGASIDLGGIAKGFVADKLKEFLIDNGITNGIIDLGGNILLIGSKPDSSNYNIGIREPFSDTNGNIAVVRASDKSIVSSGNYERYFYDENGRLYHHILDTSTGYPIDNSLNGVTIISDSSVDGDALSTTCYSLGLDEGLKFIENNDNVEAVFIDKDNQLTLSSGLSINDNIITISSK